jgi:hypothetical protein
MDQPIDHGCCYDDVAAKDLAPAAEGTVRRDYVEYPELSSLGQGTCAFGRLPTGYWRTRHR